MPYAEDFAGIYRIVDGITKTCYVGQSKRLKKRIAEHFRLLRLGIHPNPHIQVAFDAAGEDNFFSEIEVFCEDPMELDLIEEAFLTGEAKFDDSPDLFNISSTAKKPMQGRLHSDKTKRQISEAKRGRKDHVTNDYRLRLSIAQRRRALSDPDHYKKVMFIVNNPHLSYAERGRRVGVDTSTARKLALRYGHLKETPNG